LDPTSRSRGIGPAGQEGFGLLEALVALTLLTSVGFALLAWVERELDGLRRLSGHYAELELRRNILDWSRHLNPMKEPVGEMRLGDYRVEWKSTQLDVVRPQSGYPAGIGLHDLALYKVQVIAYKGSEKADFDETLLRVGHARNREGGRGF
jgi:type II secretory pathway component PulJ